MKLKNFLFEIAVAMSVTLTTPFIQAMPVSTADDTAMNQSKSNVEWTRKIRKNLVKDSTLSLDAHNVKIFINGGMVTLRGPVDSENEKQRVGDIAAYVVSPHSIINELKIKN